MQTKLIHTKIIALFLTLIPTTFFNGLCVQAQPLPEQSQTSQLKKPSQLNLPLNSQPVIPENLEQSKTPFEGRAIVGFDERIQMTSRKYPWSAVGRIEGVGMDGGGYTCTGTLLAPDIVLTNAHCVVNPKTQQVSSQIWFQPNLIYGNLQDQADLAFVQEYAVGTDFSDFEGANPHDWAILKLDRPVGEKYGTLPWASLSTRILKQNQGQFALIGYSGDFPEEGPGETAGVHIGCSILGEENGLLIHNCDTTGGASGGPIIGIIDGRFQIIGLHAGAIKYSDGKVVNYAVKMSNLDELFNR
jgi:V8-like Glu-specific endopeptidase